MLRLIVLSAVILANCEIGFAQTSVGQFLQELKADWLVGDWKSETGATISYRWALKKHLLISEVETEEWSSQGMTVYDPESEQIRLFSANDRGGVTTGTWEGDGNRLVLRLKTTTSTRESIEFGAIYERRDDDTIKLNIHEISGGKLEADSFGQFTLKRKTPVKEKQD